MDCTPPMEGTPPVCECQALVAWFESKQPEGSAMKFPVACTDCLWTGYRQWPGPTRPCPHCGGEVLRARVPRSTRSGPGFGNQTDGHGGWVTWTEH